VVVILLVAICGCFILLVAIGGYSIGGYWWLFLVILRLLVPIVL